MCGLLHRSNDSPLQRRVHAFFFFLLILPCILICSTVYTCLDWLRGSLWSITVAFLSVNTWTCEETNPREHMWIIIHSTSEELRFLDQSFDRFIWPFHRDCFSNITETMIKIIYIIFFVNYIVFESFIVRRRSFRKRLPFLSPSLMVIYKKSSSKGDLFFVRSMTLEWRRWLFIID